MDIFSRDNLDELAGVHADRTVSMFLPTHRHGPDSRPFAAEDVIRWKNLVREADDRLRQTGMPARAVDALLRPARALTEDAGFWRYQADGLAVFAADGIFRTFRVPVRLDQLVVVAPRLHLKPVLPLLVGDGRFFVLALSQNEVRLIEATRETAGEVDLAGAPRSLREALRYDDPEKQLQFHSAGPRGGGHAAVFHGHGVGTDDRKDNILRFSQQVNRGLAPVLRDGSAPLVLAAVESIAAIYRDANSYQHLVEPIVAGNPEGVSASDLRDRAWPLVVPVMQEARDAAVERFHAARGTAKATHDLVEALLAASDGRVDGCSSRSASSNGARSTTTPGARSCTTRSSQVTRISSTSWRYAVSWPEARCTRCGRTRCRTAGSSRRCCGIDRAGACRSPSATSCRAR